MKQTQHNVPDYFINPSHPITINLIGCGGTGSHMLTKLAQLNYALQELQHPGINVKAFDADDVSPPNVGRQSFLPGDIGHNKATVLISRINRAFGFAWRAIPLMYNEELPVKNSSANITITCVDKGKARVQISKMLKTKKKNHQPIDEKPFYWLDLGNDKDFGQVILGTVQDIEQPKKTLTPSLPTVEELFKNLNRMDQKDKPSCSVRESLLIQDLCVNSMMAEWGKKIIWNLFSEFRISHRGVFINLKTLTTNPIHITKEYPTK